MRILVIADQFPWPETNGSCIRTANVVRALASLGEVDFFAFEHKFRDAYDIPPGEPAVRAEVVLRPKARAGRGFDLSWLARSKLPRELAARDYAEARRTMSSFARLPYDLTWIYMPQQWWAFADLIKGPMVVDLNDLQDYKLVAELASGARRLPPRSTAALARFKADTRHRTWQLLMGTNIRRWRSLQRRIVESVDAVAVCSQLDYERLGATAAKVIPNGYTRPTEPAGRLEVGEPPTIVFPGTMIYEPNADGAEFFVNQVFPRLRRLLPEVRVRIVGRVGKRVERLVSVNGITVTGVVPDITSELRRADLLIAPIRYGGGTRIKILEGFAHQIPVVSTTLGQEGLEVTPGEHLLVADDPEEFARACWRLLTDVPLRRRLRTSAIELFANNYSWDRIRPKITALGERVAGRGLTGRVLKHLVAGQRED